MSKRIVYAAAALFVVAAFVGCPSQPPKVEKPAEPVFVAQVKNVEATTVASIAKTGSYAGTGEVVKALMTWIGTAKVQPAGAPFGMFYDDPVKVKPESTRYEVCVPVPAGTKGDKAAGVVVKMLDPAMLASTIHAGAYDKVGETYGKLAKWVVENKYEFAGPALEFYTSPENTPVESLKTEVCFIVKTAAPAADSGKAAPSEEKKEEPKKGLKGPTTK